MERSKRYCPHKAGTLDTLDSTMYYHYANGGYVSIDKLIGNGIGHIFAARIENGEWIQEDDKECILLEGAPYTPWLQPCTITTAMPPPGLQ
jgi:hypothetical protein